jgi:acyl-CoA synthetase (AMP-forming)/AMP-acid ligase II
MKFLKLLQDYLKHSSELYPDKEALIFGNKRWTYKGVNQKTDRLAISFFKHGLRRKDRVLIFLDNSPEIIFSLFGTLKAGGIFAVINGATPSQKLSYILKDSGAKLLVTQASKNAIVSKALEKIKPDKNFKIIWYGDSSRIDKKLIPFSMKWNDVDLNGELTKNEIDRLEKIRSAILNIDLAALIYTSGTTGDPKGVMSTHQNMICAAQSIIEYLENTEDDIIINTLPL